MTNDELKVALSPAAVLLAGYLVLPLIAQAVLGGHDTVLGSITISDILQAGLGVVILKKLSRLKETLAGELTDRLGKKGQPREKTLELSGKISSSAGYIVMAALLLPPLGGMLRGNHLITLAEFLAVGYTAYMAFIIWKLSGPFLAYVPPPEPAAPDDEQHTAPMGRCVKCGQRLDASMKVCAFCRHPVP